MMLTNGLLLTWAIDGAFILLMAAIGLAFLRLARGPSLPDRVVALDLITILAVAFSTLFAIASGEPAYLDVAIALALVAFLATVAFARFAERRNAQGAKTVKDESTST
jgi:multicomponent Na+:H+ antiporter subunit F